VVIQGARKLLLVVTAALKEASRERKAKPWRQCRYTRRGTRWKWKGGDKSERGGGRKKENGSNEEKSTRRRIR